MINVQLRHVVQHLHRVTSQQEIAHRTDGDLLQDFLSQHDSLAFTTIVERHGAMVLGTCRRLLGHHQDAEDAMQATFLVLAQQASTVRKSDSLASWLYSVSYRIAMKIRREAIRRKQREQRETSTVARNPVQEAAWREVQAIVDDEIQRLPENYRTVFIHCVLEGLSKSEAAKTLELPEGTVSSRLAEARKKLKHQLSKRGVTLSAALTILSNIPTLSQAQVASTVSMAIQTGPITSTALTLAKGVTFPMKTKTKVLAILLLTLGMVVAGFAFSESKRANAQESRASTEKKSTPKKNKTLPHLVKGKVFKANGKPFSGANVRLWNYSRSAKDRESHRTVADDRGRFQFRISDEEAEYGMVFVRTKEQMLDWIELRETDRKADLILRMVKDQPIEGRIVDLQGKPVVGASIRLNRLQATRDGSDLDAWLKEAIKFQNRQPRLVPPARSNAPAMKSCYYPLFGKKRLTTDKEGRFRVSGIGRERIVSMRVLAKGLETAWLQVMTRKGEDRGMPSRIHHATFTEALAPGKAIFGVIRDLKTKKPIEGVQISTGHSTAESDKQGKYRLEGVPIEEQYTIQLRKPDYFHMLKRVRGTPGIQSIPLDISMEKGIRVTGRVLDSVTKKPIRGTLIYIVSETNPNLKGSPTFGPQLTGVPSAFGTRADGTFALPAIPGPGFLCFAPRADDLYLANDLPKLAKGKIKGVPNGFSYEQFHAVIPLDIDSGIPTTCKKDITLNRRGSNEP